jgi:hypothetical protein
VCTGPPVKTRSAASIGVLLPRVRTARYRRRLRVSVGRHAPEGAASPEALTKI